MAADEKWYFTKEQLTNTPSRRCGIDADKELSYRQQAANFIQDMGQRLVVTQLCINTAIVYMHRFYVFHSLSQFHRNTLAAAALFLAAKVEEQPRKLEHVIKVAHMCLHRDQPPPDVRSEQYLEQAQDLVFNENVLLQTLGFDVAIDHPHTHVVRCCQLVKASKDLAQTSYFMASNSLHLTTMCLQYKPTVVACFCIHLACKWSNWEIPQSNEGKHWFWYVDRTVTSELLQQLTAEFLHIFDKCPSRLKRKIMSISATQSPNISHPSLPNSPFDAEPRRVQSPATSEAGPSFHTSRPHHGEKQEEKKVPASAPTRPPVDYREYREKKERERLEREKAAASANSSASSSASVSVSTTAVTTVTSTHLPEVNKHHSHHHKTLLASNVPNKHVLSSGQKGTLHHNHHHRPDMKVAQSIQQRHTIGNQSRELTRDPSRQRSQRDYNSTSGTNSGILHSHGHTAHHAKDSNIESSLPETTMHRSDVGTPQETTSHGNLQEKLSNNNHSVHRSSGADGKHQSHDKRVYDPRHKPVEHKKESEQKSYKYLDPSRGERQRKPDTLEQRCEEVRKLIEKPLPLPKSSLEPPYVQKQLHHSKYSQMEKSGGGSANMTDAKLSTGQNAFLSDKPSTTPVSTSTSIFSQKQLPLKNTISQHSSHGVSQILKDTIKNGGSSSASSFNNIDELKPDKRLRHDDIDKSSSELLQNPLQTPPGKHKSLFSPEKTPNVRESHSQRPKAKQKTPPSAAKIPKQERASDASMCNLVSPFASPPIVQQQQQQQQQEILLPTKRGATDTSTTSHKRHRTSSTSDGGHAKPKLEDTSGFEAVKMLGRVPELIQPIRDHPSNSRGAPPLDDVKLQEFAKPFEPASVARFGSTIQQGMPKNQSNHTNGMDTGSVKQELHEYHIKKEPFKTETPTQIENPPKAEYLSPIKSAQSISALLQEPLASMPSLLQNMQSFSQVTPQTMHQEQLQQSQHQQHQQQQQQQIHHHHHHNHHHHTHQQQPLAQTMSISDQVPMQPQCLSIATANETPTMSTVDISALSAPVQPITEPVVSISVSNVMPVIPVEEKRSEHHKSEKKKKEKKHKHKDKDKSKEKHKHKHKDKDKEKHRDREREKEKGEDAVTAVPIKITIPKDKLNLSAEVSGSAGLVISSTEKNKSPQNTSIKIIIPKERLKGSESVSSSPCPPAPMQPPLKIKIRTDGISRTSSGSTTTSGTPNSGLSEFFGEGRKRERERERDRDRERDRTDNKESPTAGVPPAKKQQSQMSLGYGQHRPSERQNGRHYGSSSNNKEKHASGHHKSSSKLSQYQQSHIT